MKTLLNVIWFVFSGFWLFLGYLLAALIMFVLIITIPWGIAAARIGVVLPAWHRSRPYSDEMSPNTLLSGSSR